ncbi:MAG TPA: hypothetical protein VFK27_07630, partial [Bacillales bacterium]|nr:hypothetical protein [Bacillales bacterium]
EKFLNRNGLKSVSEGFGRYHLGGHLHVGHLPLTFKHVRLLDLYMTIPFALTQQGDPTKRRKSFGRLGSVRENDFAGFEYRSLPSWYSMIPDMLPVLEWYCFLLEHSAVFPVVDFSEKMLVGYYSHSLPDLRAAVEDIENICWQFMANADYKRFAEPFFRLIRRKGDML